MKCMLLAAGLGTRLRPITEKIPKPAVELLNVPLFFYSAELLNQLNPELVVVNAHHHPEQIEAMVKSLVYPYKLSLEKEKPLGSGGGYKHAQRLLSGGSFVALNADNAIVPHESNFLKQLYSAHQKAGEPLATLLVTEDPRVGKEFNGVWFDKKGELREVTKKPSESSYRGFHFTGVAVYSQKLFDYLPEGESNIFSDALLPAIAKGERVIGFQSPVDWYETGDPKNFLASTQRLLENYASSKFLKQMIANYASDSKFERTASGISLVSGRAKVGKNTTLKGFAVLGNCEVADNCVIENSVVLSGARVAPGSIIKNQILV